MAEMKYRLTGSTSTQAVEGVKKSTACHPERSEGSPQFLMLQRLTNNCGDPSLRSESVIFLDFWPFSST
jgi:hypothetical protein